MNRTRITPREKLVASAMQRKEYQYVIIFDSTDMLPLYTKSLQGATDLLLHEFKNEKNYRIMPIHEFINLEPKETYEEN